VPNFVAIGQIVVEIWRFFDFFQDGGSPPSWICDANVWTTHEGHLVVFITVQNLVGIDDSFDHARFNILPVRLENAYSRPQNWGPAHKSGPKFTKIGEDLLRTNAPNHAKFHRCQHNDVREKRYKFFLPPSRFEGLSGPWP